MVRARHFWDVTMIPRWFDQMSNDDDVQWFCDSPFRGQITLEHSSPVYVDTVKEYTHSRNKHIDDMLTPAERRLWIRWQRYGRNSGSYDPKNFLMWWFISQTISR